MSKKARQPFLLPASAPAVIRGGSNRSSFSQCFTSQRTWKTFDIKSRFTDVGHLQISRLRQSAPYFRLSFYYFLEVGTRPSAPKSCSAAPTDCNHLSPLACPSVGCGGHTRAGSPHHPQPCLLQTSFTAAFVCKFIRHHLAGAPTV